MVHCTLQQALLRIDFAYLMKFNPNHLGHFLFLLLLGKGGVKKGGVTLGFKPGTSCTTKHCPPMARHSGVADQAVIFAHLCHNQRGFFWRGRGGQAIFFFFFNSCKAILPGLINQIC